MQTKYIYPAVFTKEGEQFSVYFPDVQGCYTGGNSLADAMTNAEDALCLMLYDMEEAGDKIPAPSDIRNLEQEHTGNEFVTLIKCDTMEYRQYFDGKAVKKTLSIPSWLNKMVERKGLNCSAIFQAALKSALDLEV